MMQTDFILLGSSAGPGVPSFFCDCVGCQEARNNSRFSRTRSGAFIDAGEDKILIDASPDLRLQLLRENITRVDCVFLTHWHYDHFGGLGELEYYVKLGRDKPVPIFLPPSAVNQFTNAFPNLADVLTVTPWEFHRQHCLNGVQITPLPANHGIETAGFLVESGGARLAYFPDTAGMPVSSVGKIAAVDWLVCDATFRGDNWLPHAHMSIDQAIALGRQVGAKNTVLTHLAIHYSQPVTTEQLAAEVADFEGVTIAYDGMRIKL